MVENINKALKFLQTKYEESAYFNQNPHDKAYRYNHTLRVTKQARMIARAEGLDEQVMIIGALLHDISYSLGFSSWEEHRNHGRLSADISKSFLQDLNLTDYQREQILLGVAIHVDDEAGIYEAERSIAARSISDADNLDRFDAYRIYENLQFMKFSEMSLQDQLQFLKEKIEAYPKLVEITHEFVTITAQNEWQEKIAFQNQFYKQLSKQMEDGQNMEMEIIGEYDESN